MHHLDSWVKRDELDATCFIITLFSAQHVSDVNTSIPRSLRLIRSVTSWVVSGSMCVGVTLQCGYGGVVSVCKLKQCFNLHTDTTPPQPNHNVTPIHIEPDTTHEVTQRISRKLLGMDVLTSETCWALNKVIIKQVASSWSLFTQQIIQCCFLFLFSLFFLPFFLLTLLLLPLLFFVSEVILVHLILSALHWSSFVVRKSNSVAIAEIFPTFTFIKHDNWNRFSERGGPDGIILRYVVVTKALDSKFWIASE